MLFRLLSQTVARENSVQRAVAHVEACIVSHAISIVFEKPSKRHRGLRVVLLVALVLGNLAKHRPAIVSTIYVNDKFPDDGMTMNMSFLEPQNAMVLCIAPSTGQVSLSSCRV